MTAVLVARGLAAGYHGHPVVEGFDLSVGEGEVVTLLGPNGAGKTTTMLALAGVTKPLAGEVELLSATRPASLHGRAKRGLGFVTEERSVFMSLTTRENLKVGRCDVGYALELFPELEPLMDRRAGLLSGGEQQILTLARALARRPRVLLADELSLGLAPLVAGPLLDALRAAAERDGVGVLLVEQHIRRAIPIADEVLILRRGKVVLRGPGRELVDKMDRIEDAYMSAETEGAVQA
jgi:branched-chain amino acid transport system ATP-binding protein